MYVLLGLGLRLRSLILLKTNWIDLNIFFVILDFQNLADGWHAHYMGFAVHMLASLPTITVHVWPCWPTINLCDISWICDGVYVHSGARVAAMSNMYA